MKTLLTEAGKSSAPAAPSSAVATSAVAEIVELHGGIITAARTTLDKAIRIGELLTEQKAQLKHGEWLPWVKENLPFSQPTAFRYMRCFERQDDIKSFSVNNLDDAYRMLSAPAEKDTPRADLREPPHAQSRFIPAPGTMIMLSGTINRARCFAIIAPAIQVGFYHIVFSSGDTDAQDSENSSGLLEFTKKPIRADHVDHSLEYMARTSTAELSKMSADELDGEEPWAYNRFAYSSHQDYVDKVILGKFWRAAA